MSLLTRTDVTALKFYKNMVLAGLGSYLNVFNKESSKLLQRLQVLNGQKIYGFVVSQCGGNIIVFGGKQFTVLAAEPSESETLFSRCFEPVICDDWLQSAVWIDEHNVAVLTSHNEVQKWDISNQELISVNSNCNNSILYSGLLLPIKDDLIVFAGTVFSEVLIHRCEEEDQALHRLQGHRGVIFSISCDPKKAIIVTTSDDRSVRIWGMQSKGKHPYDTIEYWERHLTIECKHEVYGHTSRVMRCLLTEEYIVSAGEDSGLCFWKYEGVLVKKIVAHQSAAIWAIDADETHLVSGDGGSGITLHPLSVASETGNKYIFDLDSTPKSILFTARKNLVILNEQAELVYYDLPARFSMIHKLCHVSMFKIMSLSSCKQLIAVSDLFGKLNIFIENCKDAACLRNVIDQSMSVGRVQSMHWAGNRHLIFCNDEGVLTVIAAQGTGVEYLTQFDLPQCKEKALTAAAIDESRNMFVVGDRNGNVHCYVTDNRNPVKTFKRVHGKYGPSSITIKEKELVTTGRDATVTYLSIDEEDISKSTYLRCKDLEFQWPEKFLDKDETYVCGFHERQFVVYDISTHMKVLEVPCGGGHRCWDAVRFFDKIKGKTEELIKIVYLKNSIIYVYTFELSKIVSKVILNGSQGKKINCLRNWVCELDPSINFLFTGGEDTTLRVSSLDSSLNFVDRDLFKHLSNVRTLKVMPLSENRVLVISAGGRAQLCVNSYTFEKENGELKVISRDLGDYMINGGDHRSKRMRTWRVSSLDFDPETRIMDLDAISVGENRFVILAGCSDSYLRIFTFGYGSTHTDDYKFRKIVGIKYQPTCILRTAFIKFCGKDLFVTCTTRGYITFWLVEAGAQIQVQAFFDLHPFECGINALAYRVVEHLILIASAGDETEIALGLIWIVPEDAVTKSISLQVVKTLTMKGLHCAQITGLLILEGLLVSASVDQRITVCNLKVEFYDIECDFLKQVFCDIADVQGLELIEHNKEENYIKVCVFGAGMEIMKIYLNSE